MKKTAFLKNVPKKYLVGGVAACVIFFSYSFYQFTSFESTDDAFIDGHIAPISAEVQGRVTQVLIKDNQLVKKGDVLALIDDKDYTFKRDEARADEIAAQADYEEALKDNLRYKQLLAHEEISRQEFDHTTLKVSSSQAQFMHAQARLNLAQLDLERTRIISPIDGKVSARSVETGQYVQVGQALMSIVSSDVWVTANFKETQMTRMKTGNPVEVRVDAYPGVTFKAKVDSVQGGTGEAFSLLPAQNASGNYIKVVQRVPVKITLIDPDPDHPLWPGLSVAPKVDLRSVKG